MSKKTSTELTRAASGAPATVPSDTAVAMTNPATIGNAFWAVEQSRIGFSAKAVLFGMMALAAKPAIGHGKFQKWLVGAIEQAMPKNAERCVFDLNNATQTARVYMHTAKLVLAALGREGEHNPFTGNSLEQAPDGTFDKPFSEKFQHSLQTLREHNGYSKEAAGLLAYLVSEGQSEFFQVIERICGTYSLTQLRNLLTEANKEALDDEERARKTLDAATGKPALTDDTGVQWSKEVFFEKLNAGVQAVEDAISEPGLLALPKARVLDIAEQLIAKGEALKRAISQKKTD